MNALPNKKNQQEHGMTLIEVMIAMGILGVIAVAGFIQMQNANVSIDKMRRAQTSDALEYNLRSILSRDDVIIETVKNSSSTELIKCVLSSSGGCQNRKKYAVSVYLPGQTTPFTGSEIWYGKTGEICTNKNPDCKPRYRIATQIITYCGSSSLCTFPAHIAIEYFVRDERKKKIMRKDLVERYQPIEDLTKNLSVSCSGNQVLRGIGMNSEPLCIPLDDLIYEDGQLAKGGFININVTPKDCRTLKNPNSNNDQWFVRTISKGGEVQCAPKTW